MLWQFIIAGTKECFEGHKHPQSPQIIHPQARGVIAHPFNASMSSGAAIPWHAQGGWQECHSHPPPSPLFVKCTGTSIHCGVHRRDTIKALWAWCSWGPAHIDLRWRRPGGGWGRWSRQRHWHHDDNKDNNDDDEDNDDGNGNGEGNGNKKITAHASRNGSNQAGIGTSSLHLALLLHPPWELSQMHDTGDPVGGASRKASLKQHHEMNGAGAAGRWRCNWGGSRGDTQLMGMRTRRLIWMRVRGGGVGGQMRDCGHCHGCRCVLILVALLI